MITLTMSWDILPGRGGIDNVYGPTGRIYSPTTAGLDAKRREPSSKLLPSRRGPTPPNATASRTFHRTKHNPTPHTHTHR